MRDSLQEIYTYLAAMWRRRWGLLGIAWLLCLVGWAIVTLLPNKFESSARVYADTEGVLRPLLKGIAVESDLDHQLEVMERTLLSRPNLESVVRMTDLDHTATTTAAVDKIVKRLAERIEVGLQQENLFSVKFEDTNPQLAQRVVQSLLTIFVEGNLGQNRKDMDAARRFIDEQIAGYQRQLEVAEDNLANFKQENMGLLPGQDGYREQLARARAKLEAARAAYAEAETRHQELGRQLDEVPRFHEMLVDGFAGPPSDSVMRSLEYQQKIDLLLMRYTEKHPEVIAVRRRLADIRREMAETDAAAGPGPAPSDMAQANGGPERNELKVSNPVYEKIKVQLVEEAANMATLRGRIERHQAKVAKLDRPGKNVPMVEAQLTKLTRDYQMLKSSYEKLLGRREAAKISQDREIKSEKVQFRVIDPAQLPTLPSGPNRPLFLSVALVVAIGAALAFGWVLARVDDTFAGGHRLKQAFGIPVLGGISMVYSTGEKSLRVLGLWGFGAVCLTLFAVYGGLLAIELSVGLPGGVVADASDNGLSRLIDLARANFAAAIGGN